MTSPNTQHVDTKYIAPFTYRTNLKLATYRFAPNRSILT